MKKAWLPILLNFLISACSTSVGNLKDSDYIWSSTTSNQSYQSAYKSIKRGVEKCESDWRVDSDLYTETQEGEIAIYLKNPLFATPTFLLAKITVVANGSGSKVTIGVVPGMDENFAKSRKTAKKVSAWANGNPSCE